MQPFCPLFALGFAKWLKCIRFLILCTLFQKSIFCQKIYFDMQNQRKTHIRVTYFLQISMGWILWIHIKNSKKVLSKSTFWTTNGLLTSAVILGCKAETFESWNTYLMIKFIEQKSLWMVLLSHHTIATLRMAWSLSNAKIRVKEIGLDDWSVKWPPYFPFEVSFWPEN